LFVSAFTVYNLNLQRIASGDTVAASLLPFSVWLDGSVRLDRFYPHLAGNALPLGFYRKDGHAYSAYPIALPLLLTPLYAPAALVVHAGGWSVTRVVLLAGILEKLLASLVAACSVVLFYVLASRLASRKTALLLALIYAFATETWTISSQALWQHGGDELAVIAGLISLVRLGEKPGDRWWLMAAGLSAAAAIAIRPTSVLFLAAMCVWLLASRRGLGDWARFLVWPSAAGAATLAYNLRIFGRLTGGYSPDFDGPFWRGLAGLLASPSRGLFVYTPMAFFSLLGTWVWLKNRRRGYSRVYLVCALYSVSLILLMSYWRVWWGGHTFGPRLLTDIVPCLVLLILPAMEMISAKAALRVAFAAALALSVGIQAIGAFCYPKSRWDETPVAVGARVARLWDWRDSPIARGLSVGPRLGPEAGLFPTVRRVF
jgi:hypothetical protein